MWNRVLRVKGAGASAQSADGLIDLRQTCRRSGGRGSDLHSVRPLTSPASSGIESQNSENFFCSLNALAPVGFQSSRKANEAGVESTIQENQLRSALPRKPFGKPRRHRRSYIFPFAKRTSHRIPVLGSNRTEQIVSATSQSDA